MKWILMFCALAFAGCAQNSGDHAGDHDDHGDHAGHGDRDDQDDHGSDEPERGPMGGRLLRSGDIAIEVTIFEDGVPPQYRLYAYSGGEPVPASEVAATVRLTRLDGETNDFRFRADGLALIGDGVVGEPHSFDVEVNATIAGKAHRWAYASYEGRVAIAADVAREAGIETAVAGPARIRESATLHGRAIVDPNKVARVRARYPGAIVEVLARQGETVRAGQALASIENRDSLRRIALMAPITGRVRERAATVGDVAGDQVLFEIVDDSVLLADLVVYGSDAARIAVGQPATLIDALSGAEQAASIEALLPEIDPMQQALIARMRIDNTGGTWRPGGALSAEVRVAEREVALAVERHALQTFRDFTVVFAQVGDTFEVRMLELGRSDATHVEVLGGLKPGTRYVTAQSFLIKADIEKSGASHDH